MKFLRELFSGKIVPVLAVLIIISGIGAREKEMKEPVCEVSVWSGNAMVQIPSVILYKNRLATDSLYSEEISDKVNRFYAANGHYTKWLGTKHPSDLYYSFFEAVLDGAKYGLKPADYRCLELRKAVGEFYDQKERNTTSLIGLDMQITSAYFLYTAHLTEGRIKQPGHKNAIWLKKHKSQPGIETLKEVQSPEHLSESLVSLHPKTTQYEQLKEAFALYTRLDGKYPEGSLPLLYTESTIEPGDCNAAIPGIRRRLMILDPCLTASADSMVYDPDLQKAIKFFQATHGLEEDARIGQNTVAFLNMSFREKADLIELNLERARWQCSEMGDIYIVVNIPEYKLHVYEAGIEVLQMRVIVGKEYQSTPVFNDSVTGIVFRPAWNVPQSIVRKEMIPQLEQDTAAINGKRFKVYENGVQVEPGRVNWADSPTKYYQFVQEPGGGNALGLVKFVMKNDMHVYMHDTPADYLFSRTERAMSHGCIRLEYPEKLAQYLLGDQGWDKQTVQKAMHSGQSKHMKLTRPIHVQITYQTAWVDEQGNVNFRSDIYGHDAYHMASITPPDVL